MVSMKLLSIAEREYKGTRAKPAPKKFKALNLNPGRFDASWDRKRGSAVRLMSVVLREDDELLRRRVAASPESERTYQSAVAWFMREAEMLRKSANLLEVAAGRLSAVLDARAN
jgi:hypothetical protein